VPKMIKIGSFLTELFKNKNVSVFGDTMYIQRRVITESCTQCNAENIVCLSFLGPTRISIKASSASEINNGRLPLWLINMVVMVM